MKYFVRNDDREGTCYHEFYKGHWDEEKMEFWSADSIYMHDDMMCCLKFGELVFKVITTFAPYGVTEINTYNWEFIYEMAKNENGELREMIEELALWVNDTFSKHDVFTILRIWLINI